MNPPPIPKKKSSSKKPLLIIGIVVGCVILGILGIVGLGALWIFTAKDQALTEHDRQLVVTVEEVALYFEDFEPSEEYVTFTKERYIDGSIEIFYEYDSPQEGEPYISVTISHEINSSDANMVYGLEWSAMRLGLNINDRSFELKEDNQFYKAGENSRFGNIIYDGTTTGHVLVARSDNSIYAFNISGYILDDPEIWAELFDKRINELLTLQE